jgi:hypothetical protein
MKVGVALAITVFSVALVGCANMGPVSARQRAEAATDVPEDHPHPPGHVVPIPGDGSFERLRCWDNGEDRVCSRSAD